MQLEMNYIISHALRHQIAVERGSQEGFRRFLDPYVMALGRDDDDDANRKRRRQGDDNEDVAIVTRSYAAKLCTCVTGHRCSAHVLLFLIGFAST